MHPIAQETDTVERPTRPRRRTRLVALAVALCPAAASAQTNTEAVPVATPGTTPGTTPGAGTPVVGVEVVPVEPLRAPPPSGHAVGYSVADSLLAGFHNDLFFLGNRSGSFWIAPAGRLQLDGVAFTGGVTDDYATGAAMTYRRGDVKDGFLMRRARLEMFGGFLERYSWQIGADFDVAAAPIATDLIFNARAWPILNLQLGQFDAPFTMENRTTDKYLDFMERSLAVRSLGVPTNKEMGLMLWGEPENRLVYYSVGIFNGDGQNRLDRDNNLDVLARAFVHPFITVGGPLADLQVGGSFRYGTRGASVDYAYNNMSTPGGYTFFNSSLATGASPVTLVPDGVQLGAAGELDLPIDRFDLRGEFVWVRNETREMAGSTLAGTNPLRLGDLTGYGWYAQVGYWIWGTPGVNGRPGYENPPALHLEHPDPAVPPQGIELLARFESLRFTYSGGSRATGGRTAATYDGDYNILGLDVGANYWATKHVRFSLDYMQYLYGAQPASAAMPLATDNRAHGPHGGESSFGELMFRVGLAI